MSDERNIHAADDYDKAGQIYSYAFGADGHVVADDETISWRWTGFALSDARARAAIEAALATAHGEPLREFRPAAIRRDQVIGEHRTHRS